MAFDINRLLTVLNNTGLQTKDNSLYQLLKQLIEGIGSLNGQVDSINGAINVINEAIANTISTVVQLHLGTDSGDSNSGTDNIPVSSTSSVGSPVAEMTPILASVFSDDGIDGLDGRDGIDGVAGVDGKSPISLIPQDGIDGLDSFQLVSSSGQPIPQSQSISNLMQYLSGIGVDSSEAEPNIIPFYLNAADIAMLGRTNIFRTIANVISFRVESTTEAQLTIAADSGNISSDTDGYFRVVIDGTPGTLKAFFGYDQGNDRAVIGYNAAGGFVINNANALGVLNKMYLYNNIALAGWGVPAIYAYGRLTGQTAAIASLCTYLVGAADGSFEISANVNVTAVTSSSFKVRILYTDESGTSRTLEMFMVSPSGVGPTRTVVNGLGVIPYLGITHRIRAQAATTITIDTSGSFVDVTYNIEADIKQVA